jgi:hypothetical protein
LVFVFVTFCSLTFDRASSFLLSQSRQAWYFALFSSHLAAVIPPVFSIALALHFGSEKQGAPGHFPGFFVTALET